jgi:hypothetical protein
MLCGSTTGLTIADNGAAAVLAGATINGTTISSGTLDILSGAVIGSGASLSFAPGGAGSLLILNGATHFGGLVAGFSGTAEMDLTSVPYSAAVTTFGWSQTTTGAGASGTLTVSEAGTAANITLLGQYAQANFAVSNGPVGGTLVTAPSQSAAITDPNPTVLANLHP